MEVEFPSSPDLSLEIPSIIEAISSSIDDSRLNFDEFDKKSLGEVSTTTEQSDHMDVDSNWSIPPHKPNHIRNNANYCQNYQQQQWNFQQGYSPYPQYGYMTPSPYNSYYMQSPPVDYHHNYAYNTNVYEQPQQQHPYIFTGNQNSNLSPQNSQNSCTICLKSFKSASNLSRHFTSKTHLKRLESKQQNPKVTVVRVKKTRVNGLGSSYTDISKDEKEFLWQLDDEIWSFLKEYEDEKMANKSSKDLILPTPPLSPNSRAVEAKKFEIPKSQNKIKNEKSEHKNHPKLAKNGSIITIASSSEHIEGSPVSVRSSSVDSVGNLSDNQVSKNIISNSDRMASQDANLTNIASNSTNLTSDIFDVTLNSDEITSKNSNCTIITSNYNNLTSNLSNVTSNSDIIAFKYSSSTNRTTNMTNLTSKNSCLTNVYPNSNLSNLTSNSDGIVSLNSNSSNLTSNSCDLILSSHGVTSNLQDLAICSTQITSKNSNLTNLTSNLENSNSKSLSLKNLNLASSNSTNSLNSTSTSSKLVNIMNSSKDLKFLNVTSNMTNATSANLTSKIIALNSENLTSKYFNSQNISTTSIAPKNVGSITSNSSHLTSNSSSISSNSSNITSNSTTVKTFQQKLSNELKNVKNVGNFRQNSLKYSNWQQSSLNEQKVVQNCQQGPEGEESHYVVQCSPMPENSPTVLIQQETGEKYEIIFCDENFAENL